MDSGGTGLTAAFLGIGAIYGMIVATAAMTIRRPIPGYRPEGFDQEKTGLLSPTLIGNVNSDVGKKRHYTT